jgi:IAA-amino acid hydrolase
MGSEDFAFYQEMIPGYIFFLGMQNETHKQLHPPLSHPTLKSMKMHFMQLWLLGILFKTQPEVTLPEENYRDEF